MRRFSVLAILATLASPGLSQSFTPGNLFVGDSSGLVLEFAPNRSLVRSFTSVADFGSSPAKGIAFRPDGLLEVAADATNKLVRFDSTGTKVDETSGGGLDSPFGLAIGPNGERWVVSEATGEVLVFDAAGALRRSVSGGGMGAPRALAFGPNGHVFVADETDDVVYEFDPSGNSVGGLDPGAGTAPFGVASAPDGTVYVTSTAPPGIRVLDATGIVQTITDPGLTTPRGLAFGFDERLYVANESPPAVLRIKITPGGNTIVQTITDAAMTGPLFLAFAPARFAAKASGKRYTTGGIVKFADAYDPTTATGPVLSVTPEGVLLWLGDDPADPNDLASILGVGAVAWRGASVTGAGRLTLAGGQASVYGDLIGGGVLSGNVSFDGATSLLVAPSTAGTFVFQAGDSLLVGKIKGKRLP
ncbi:MAG TPA: NHL repeat-containing protein [Planctomycetota bacterium]|jgi:DNA-binding beta-propeller fold protein YncE|nr:NHL repeat-containing protein [Planctomycetota bacterium]